VLWFLLREYLFLFFLPVFWGFNHFCLSGVGKFLEVFRPWQVWTEVHVSLYRLFGRFFLGGYTFCFCLEFSLREGRVFLGGSGRVGMVGFFFGVRREGRGPGRTGLGGAAVLFGRGRYRLIFWLSRSLWGVWAVSELFFFFGGEEMLEWLLGFLLGMKEC